MSAAARSLLREIHNQVPVFKNAAQPLSRWQSGWSLYQRLPGWSIFRLWTQRVISAKIR